MWKSNVILVYICACSISPPSTKATPSHIHSNAHIYKHTQIHKRSGCSCGVLKLLEALPFVHHARFLLLFHDYADQLEVMLFSRHARSIQERHKNSSFGDGFKFHPLPIKMCEVIWERNNGY